MKDAPGPFLPKGHALAFYNEIDSTNAEAIRCLQTGERGPLWIWALRQSEGRGRHGRDWQSLTGNLFATLALNVRCAPALIPQLSFVAALAVHGLARHSLAGCKQKAELILKWPNDLLLGGEKLAGILLETCRPGTAVIGFGVNLIRSPEPDNQSATCLAAHGAPVSAAQALTQLSSQFNRYWLEWDEGRNFAAIRKAWLARAMAPGTLLDVRTGEGHCSGAFETIDEDGALILRLASGGAKRIISGDVGLAS